MAEQASKAPKAMFKLQFVTVSTDTNKRQVLDSIVLDAALSEVHDSDAEVTEFPVEQGSDISDNVRVKPKMLQVEALITDTHLASYRDGNASRGVSGPDRDAKSKLAALEKYQTAGTLIDVETGLKSYQNMVIKSLRTPRDKHTKNAVRCTIVLQSIIIAQSQTVVIKQADPKAQPAVPKGQKTPTAADAGTKKLDSIAKADVFDQVKPMLKAASDSLKALVGSGG